MPADLHRRPAMRADPVSGQWISSETLGLTANSTTGTDFGGTMTCQVQLAMDCLVSEVIYDFRNAGTYQLRIDGTLIDTVSPGVAGDTNVIANVAPIRVTRGPHEFKVTKTAGAAGWDFRVSDGEGFTPWLAVGYWQEAGGAEAPPLKLTVVRTQRPRFYRWPSITGTSGTPRVHAAQFFTWNRPVECVGITIGMGGALSNRYQVTVDGAVRGMTGNIPIGNLIDGIITFDTPAVFLPGDMHFIDVTTVAATASQAQAFVSTSGPGWLTDEWATTGPWLNPGGTSPASTALALGWHINPLGP